MCIQASETALGLAEAGISKWDAFILGQVPIKGGAGDKKLVDRKDQKQPGLVVKGPRGGGEKGVSDLSLTSPTEAEKECLHSNDKHQTPNPKTLAILAGSGFADERTRSLRAGLAMVECMRLIIFEVERGRDAT